MAESGVDIDLYADVESDFPAEDFNTSAAGDSDAAGDAKKDISKPDLYDDVITNVKDEEEEEKPSGGGSSTITAPSSGTTPTTGRKYHLYVGNLTWWTTDADIADSVLSVGVNDFIEVKFYENRINGQSKGFCCISLASEESMKVVMEKLPKKELHGQSPVVTYATKQALHQFESQSKTRPTPPPGSGPGGHSGSHHSGPGGPPPYRPGMRPPHHSGPRPSLLSHPPRHGAPPHHHQPRFPPPGMGAPPGLRVPGIPPPTMPVHVPPPVVVGAPPPRHITHPPPAPHVNPAFFPTGPPPAAAAIIPGISEAEFEEIMSRNRTVSSSAISRAVQDAAAHDYASAIETLVTAISLIRYNPSNNADPINPLANGFLCFQAIQSRP